MIGDTGITVGGDSKCLESKTSSMKNGVKRGKSERNSLCWRDALLMAMTLAWRASIDVLKLVCGDSARRLGEGKWLCC